MPTRRNVLAGSGIMVAGFAGCLDDFDDEENEQEQDEEVQTVSDDDDGFTEDEAEGQLENRQTREEIVSTYNDAIGSFNDGMRNRESAVGAYNDRNFDTARSRYESAEEDFSEARSKFRDAIDLTYEIEAPQAREECEKAAENASLWREAMREAQLGAGAAMDENFERANSRSDAARNLEREAEQMNVVNPDTIETILDLD